MSGKMLNPVKLLENILFDIEKGLKKNINAAVLSRKYAFSEAHLRRIFSFSFKQSIAAYIRSRTLAVSLDSLLNTDTNILDIALEYGFDYEQSYIRTFKREFGITPGHLRKTGQVVKIQPPLHLFDENKLKGSAFFGPDFVMVPQFHIIGKSHNIPFDNSVKMAPEVGKHFWDNDRKHIKRTVSPRVYIGLTRNIDCRKQHSEYLPAVQVKNLSHIPHGYNSHTFDTTMCARFRYIGQHHYYDINRNIADMMYNAIWKFADDEQAKYKLFNDKVYFEKIDTGLYDGNYCQMEWFAPVAEKSA